LGVGVGVVFLASVSFVPACYALPEIVQQLHRTTRM